MKKAFSMILVIIMAAAILVCPAMAAGGGGGGGTGGGGGNNPLNVVSVTINGENLAGAVTEADGTITIVFDRGMDKNADTTKAAIGIKGTAYSVSFDGDRSFTVSFSELAAGEYTLVIGAEAKANNGNTLGSDYKVKFTVAEQETQPTEEPVEDPDVPDVPEGEDAPQTGESMAVYFVAVLAAAGAVLTAKELKKEN